MEAPEFITVFGVAVEVPDKAAITQKKANGLVVPELQGGLRALKVVASTSILFKSGEKSWVQPGDCIYVNTVSIARFPWAQEVFEIEGQRFIVVPHEFVVAVRVKR